MKHTQGFGLILAGYVAALGTFWALSNYGTVDAQTVELTKEYIHPVRDWGFSQVVAVSDGRTRTIHVSGQVGGGADHVEQAESTWRNVTRRLEAAGATPEDVVKLRVYIVDISPEAVQAVKEAKDRHFTAEDQPASTWVGVTKLVGETNLIEIEATAVVAVN